MIDTSELENLDLCLVTLGQDDDDEGEPDEIFCIFIENKRIIMVIYGKDL